MSTYPLHAHVCTRRPNYVNQCKHSHRFLLPAHQKTQHPFTYHFHFPDFPLRGDPRSLPQNASLPTAAPIRLVSAISWQAGVLRYRPREQTRNRSADANAKQATLPWNFRAALWRNLRNSGLARRKLRMPRSGDWRCAWISELGAILYAHVKLYMYCMNSLLWNYDNYSFITIYKNLII